MGPPGDYTADQPESTIARHRFGSRLLSEEAFQNLRSHLATLGVALLLALPVGALVFLVLGSVWFAFDDRPFWNSQADSLAEFSYALALFVVAAVPATFVLLGRGHRDAIGFVIDRGSLPHAPFNPFVRTSRIRLTEGVLVMVRQLSGSG